MATNKILIDGKSYLLASGNSLPKGATDWNVSLEPSQRGDPSQLRVAKWQVGGPIGNSYEGPEGFLGVDYGDDVDTRWDGATYGPLTSLLTLSTYDATSYAPTVRPVGDYIRLWTPSAGTSSFANVDEAVADDDGTYNSGTKATGADYLVMPVTGLPVGTRITSVTVTVRARKETALDATTQLTIQLRTGGVGRSNITTLTNDTAYHDYTLTTTTGWDSTLPWPSEYLDRALIAYSVGATGAGDTVRVTQVFMTVTAAVPNACGSALASGPAGEKFMYVIRGRDVAKVLTSELTLIPPTTLITLADNATSILATDTPAGTQEVSIGITGANDYRVITTVAAVGTADTHAANADGQDLRIIGQAPERVVGLIGQNTYMNILSASNTMANGNWQSTGVLSGKNIIPTGFALLGKTWVIGTNEGPYLLNPDTGLFEALVDEIDQSLENCRATIPWTPVGVLTGTVNGLRFVNDYGSASVGPENLPRNTSPIHGVFTALTGTARWLIGAIYNRGIDTTFLLAGRPREEGDPPGTSDMAWFNLATFPAKRVDFLRVLGGEAGRVIPTLVGGYDGNAFYMKMGRTENWTQDTNGYSYEEAGTLHLTELRREPSLVKDLEAVEFTIEGGGSTFNTVTAGFSVDGGSVQSLPTISEDISGVYPYGLGAKRQVFATAGVPLAWATGKRIKPRITFSQPGVNRPACRVVGTLDLYYRERPVQMEVARFTLQLDTTLPEHGMEAQQEDLLALVDGAGPVLIPSDRDLDSGYWKVTSVDIKTLASPAAGPTTVGDLRYAFVTAKRWPQATGD